MNNSVKKDVLKLWEYLCLDTNDIKAECIIGLGSILQLVPEKCAELYKKGYGDYIIFSGNCGKGTKGVITGTEAQIFKDCAIRAGVLEDKIMVENRATNTYENFKYIKEVLESRGYDPKSFLIVGKPYQERRARAIAGVELEGKEFSVSSFNMSLDDFINYVVEKGFMSVSDVINEMVAEINIGLLAPAYGLQVYDEIPDDVVESYNRLVELGYDRDLVNDEIIGNVIKSWKR